MNINTQMRYGAYSEYSFRTTKTGKGDTDRIENELLKNEMIARVEAYKTPSGMIKLEVEQKIPILRP